MIIVFIEFLYLGTLDRNDNNMNDIQWSWDSFTLGIFAGIIFIIIVACILEVKYDDIKKIFIKKEKVNDTDRIILSDNATINQFNFTEVLYKNLICPCCLTDCTKVIDITNDMNIEDDEDKSNINIVRIISWEGRLKDIGHNYCDDTINNKIKSIKYKSPNKTLIRNWGRANFKCNKCNSSWLSEPFLMDTVPENIMDNYIEYTRDKVIR